MRKAFWAGLAVGVMALGLHSMASAIPIMESGDAGSTIATAQILPGGTDKVTGYLGAGGVDMFGFGWGGGGFYVSSVGPVEGIKEDSQLFLFSANGMGIQANDDGIASAGPAYLQLSSLASGTYFLGISGFNNDPYDTNKSLMFQSSPYRQLYGPQTSAPLAYWGGGGFVNDYIITFASLTIDGTIITMNPTTSPNTPTPEPATMLLMGTGLAGLAGFRLRKKKQ